MQAMCKIDFGCFAMVTVYVLVVYANIPFSLPKPSELLMQNILKAKFHPELFFPRIFLKEERSEPFGQLTHCI